MQAMNTLDQKAKIYLMLSAPFLALVIVLIYMAAAATPVVIVPVLLLLIAALVSGAILFSGVGAAASDPDALRNKNKVVALNRVQAVIEFSLDGTIIDANENFLSLMGYSLAEVQGRHHSIFVEDSLRNTPEYRQFWAELNRGEFKVNEFKRIKKNGEEVWIHGSYNPIFDDAGVPVSVVKFATDITARKRQESENLRHANMSSALQFCQANVMLADEGMNIVYMNDCVRDMLSKRESQIRQALPDFRVDRLVGTCVDSFHVNPRHQRSIINDLKEPYSTDLNLAGLVFGLVATPWFDLQGKRIGTVVEWDDKTDRVHKEKQEREIAAENARVRQALDNVSTNVMIADTDFNIIYMNDSVLGMMRNAESDIRKDLKNFDTSRLMGANIDTFHKNPAHQRRLAEHLTSTYRSEIKIGGRTFSLTANPIITADGDRLGTVVEWSDRTDEVTIQSEIDEVISAATQGNLAVQIDMAGKQGFFADLSKGLNSLVSTIEVAVNDIVRVLGAMAKGDLTERITRDYEGSFGQLKEDVNLTTEKLTEVIGNIRQSSNSIASAANEISQGNADLSQRTEEQASALEETASSMEEMTSTVRQSAENAMSANSLAMEAQEKAKQGGAVVSKAVVSMEEINKASKRIADIIGVIDEIAFQTNLLALNAAVEAARAGEQGRGFAVVAGEVRNLAQRSAGAAKEIKDLIRDSVTKVEDGSQLVNASGETLQQIVAAVEKVTTIMRDISDAAQEQTSGIEQVNTAVSEMDEMTQQNAALVEQATAAGESMAEQASNMNRMMDFFTVSHLGHTHHAPQSVAVKAKGKPGASKNNASLPSASGYSGGADGDEWEEF